MAPVVVPSSSSMATRRLVRRSRTYAAAAPLEVAITDTMEAPMAYRMSMWYSRVSTGTTTMPPPSPTSEPKKPATTEMPSSVNANSNGVIYSFDARIARQMGTL